MTGRLSHEREAVDDGLYLALRGSIDADGALRGAAVPSPGPRRVVLDLGDVARVTSIGVRELMDWQSELDRRGVDVTWVGCSPTIVTQLNHVANFAGKAAIATFSAPYFCERCNRETPIALDTAEVGRGRREAKAPARTCPTCTSPLQFDDIEESYFAFTREVRTVSDPVALRRFLSEVGRRRRVALIEDQPTVLEDRPAALTALVADRVESPPPPPSRALSLADRLFYVAAGALAGVLTLVVYHIVANVA